MLGNPGTKLWPRELWTRESEYLRVTIASANRSAMGWQEFLALPPLLPGWAFRSRFPWFCADERGALTDTGPMTRSRWEREECEVSASVRAEASLASPKLVLPFTRTGRLLRKRPVSALIAKSPDLNPSC